MSLKSYQKQVPGHPQRPQGELAGCGKTRIHAAIEGAPYEAVKKSFVVSMFDCRLSFSDTPSARHL
jgi:hypothetical protein